MRLRWSYAVLLLVMIAQGLTHIFWLTISAHSGQVAIPWMMNRGATLFDQILEQHAPLSSAIAALAQRALPFAAVDVDRLLNLILVLLLTLLIYVLTMQLSDGNQTAAVAAILVFALFVPVYGNVLFYFDTLLGFWVLLATVIWVRHDDAKSNWESILTGLILGLATISKQHAWLVVILFLLWIIWNIRQIRVIAFFLGGVIIPTAIVMIIVALQGNFDNYIYWNWTFNLAGLMDSVPLDGDFFRKLLLTNIFVLAFAWLALQQRRGRAVWVLILLIWTTTMATLYPRVGEIHVMAHLPFLAVMSGVVLGGVVPVIWSSIRSWRNASGADVVLVGVVLAIFLSWLWMGVVAYLPSSIGQAGTLAHDEYATLVDQLNNEISENDTLYILPQTDSTPQLHTLTNLLPPNTWVKGWHWYFEGEGVTNTLLAEWEENAPNYVVIFPDLLEVGEPGITPLVEFVESNYEELFTSDEIIDHGEATLYRRVGG